MLWVYRVSALQCFGQGAEVAKPWCKSGRISEIGDLTVQSDDVVDAETAVIGEPLEVWCDARVIKDRQHNISC